MKRLISLLAVLVISMAMFQTTTVNAENVSTYSVDEAAQPCYEYTASVTSVLTKSGTTAYCNSKVTGMTGVTNIEGTQYLEKRCSGGGVQWMNGAAPPIPPHSL